MTLIADRFGSPVGTPEERLSGQIWPGPWHSTNNFMHFYYLGPGAKENPAYHTGVDLVSNTPGHTAHAPIYAAANGRIIFARRIPASTWGNIIIQECQMPGGTFVYLRYAHEDLTGLVYENQDVTIGQQIATVGNAFGRFAYHLHFDIGGSVLKSHPADWPGVDLERIRSHYIDPTRFIRENMDMATNQTDALNQVKAQLQQALKTIDAALSDTTPAPAPVPQATVLYSMTDGLRVRSLPTTIGGIIGQLALNAKVSAVDAGTADGHAWVKLMDGQYPGGYVAKEYMATSPK